MTPSPSPGLERWTPDEVAECLPVSMETSGRLWSLMASMPSTKPLGGDGSNGTVEWPEPTEPDHSVLAVWSKLTPEERAEINNAYKELTR